MVSPDIIIERARPDLLPRVDQPGSLAGRHSTIALITHVGPFNYTAWAGISENPVRADEIAREYIKDTALLIEGANPGAGRNFQRMLATVTDADVDLPTLMVAEDERTTAVLGQRYIRNPFMRDISSYLMSGVPYAGLDCDAERDNADGFATVYDLGHFSRIMQIDMAREGNRDDLKKLAIVQNVARELERNLHTAFTNRGQGVHGGIAEQYPVPSDANTEGGVIIAERASDGQAISVIKEKRTAPNISFMLTLKHPQNFGGQDISVSQGRGEHETQRAETTEELLTHLAAQFEVLLTAYTLEKAALLFDKFVYKTVDGDLGLTMAVAQRVKTENGAHKMKVLTIGDTAVAVVDEKRGSAENAADIIAKLRADTPDDELLATAIQAGLTEADLPRSINGSGLGKSQKGQLIGKTRAALNRSEARVTHFIAGGDSDASVGSFEQAPHRITEIELEGQNPREAFVLVPPSIASKVDAQRIIGQSFKSAGDVSINLVQRKPDGASVALPTQKAIVPGIQIIRKTGWSRDEVISQIDPYLRKVEGFQSQYARVDASFQYAHFHPTGRKHTWIQEQATDIAEIVGTHLKSLGVGVEGRALADEYHTTDRMDDWNTYYSMLRDRSPSVFTEFIQESSPVMRLVGDAFIRRMLLDSNTFIQKSQLVHDMTDGYSRLELWDGAVDTNGQPARGRQACVPFNVGMDVVLMDPAKAEALFKKYILNRYPDSQLSQIARTNPDETIHDVIAEIMKERDIAIRNKKRLAAINEVDRHSFAELMTPAPDSTAFDLVILDELRNGITDDVEAKKRIPLVTHVLETNYDMQHKKAAYMWENYGFPKVPVYRISFNPDSRKIKLLTSHPPQTDPWAEFLDTNRDVIQQVRQEVLHS